MSASRTAKWLVGQRNALGGFGSTQDTIVGFHGLTTFSTKVRTNVDMTIVLESDTWRKEVRITHVLERAVAELVTLDPSGCGVDHRLVYIHQRFRLGEGLQNERRQPQASLIVPITEGGEAAVGTALRQLPLVPDRHQVLGLGHYLGL